MRELMRRQLTALAKPFRRFGRAKSGAVAVEFALLLTPLMFALAATLETGLIYFTDSVLQAAVDKSSRNIRTGIGKSWDETAFRTNMCTYVTPLIDCSSLVIDVKAIANYSDFNPAVTLKADGSFPTGTGFTATAPGAIVQVRVWYKWPLFFNKFSPLVASTPDGSTQLEGTALFKNEIFPTT